MFRSVFLQSLWFFSCRTVIPAPRPVVLENMCFGSYQAQDAISHSRFVTGARGDSSVKCLLPKHEELSLISRTSVNAGNAGVHLSVSTGEVETDIPGVPGHPVLPNGWTLGQWESLSQRRFTVIPRMIPEVLWLTHAHIYVHPIYTTMHTTHMEKENQNIWTDK